MKRKFVRVPRTSSPLLAACGLLFVPLRSPLSAQFQAGSGQTVTIPAPANINTTTTAFCPRRWDHQRHQRRDRRSSDVADDAALSPRPGSQMPPIKD